jgi:hypothetical protein
MSVENMKRYMQYLVLHSQLFHLYYSVTVHSQLLQFNANDMPMITSQSIISQLDMRQEISGNGTGEASSCASGKGAGDVTADDGA